MRLGTLLMAVVILLACSMAGVAQTSPDLEQGMKPYGSYHGGNLDNISLTNGNLYFHAPLFSYPQRGGELPFVISLQYNNKNFSFYQTPCPPGTPKPLCPLHLTVVFGPGPLASGTESLGNSVKIGVEAFPNQGGVNIDTSLSLNGAEIFFNSNSAVTPDGSVHQLVKTDHGLVALDGSGFSAAANPLAVINSRGTFSAQATALDRNGNQLTLNTDTLGRSFPSAPVPTRSPAPLNPSTASLGACPALNYANQAVTFAYFWNLPTVNGGTLPLILCYTSVYVRTNFLGGAHGPNQFDVSDSFPMLQSVVFPDNTYWAFQYDAGDPNNSALYAFGDLLKVTLPTGGSLAYTWETARYCGSGASRSVLTRTVDANDGTGPHTWQYNNGVVTDPLGNDTVHTISPLGGTCSLYETQTQYYQGSHTSGTLLKTVNTDYQFTPNPYDPVLIGGGSWAAVNSITNVFPIRVTTTLPNGLVSKVETDYDTALAYHGPLDGITSNQLECPPPTDPPGGCQYGTQVTNPVTNYTGSYGKVTATREYDWGRGAPGSLLRQTIYSYQWQNGTNAASYLSNNFLDLVSTTTVYDGESNQVAKTTYAYDETTPIAPSPAISTQHTVPATNIRGNQTTVSHWLNTSNSMISSHAAYFDTGELQSSTDPLGHTTTHLYDSAYAGAFSTQTCSPSTGGVTHCVSGTYDSNTGLLTSLTNENATTQASGNSPGDSAHTSSFIYDLYWRLVSAKAPPDPANSNLQDTTSFTYVLSPLMVTRQKSVTTGLNDSASAYFDGVGRSLKSTHALPNGTATTVTTFDAAGRTSSVTNPYVTTSDPTYGVTQMQYDGLGRGTQTTKQDGSITTVQYNQVAAVSGNTECTVTTDEAGKVRKTCTDALGRLIEVDEPGTGVNGPGTPGTGTITISGSLHSGTSSGTNARGWFTVNGMETGVQTWICFDTCVRGPFVWDSGSVNVIVNGVTYSASYGQGSTASSVANSLAAQMTGTPAGASSPGTGATSNLTADQPGPNYSLSSSSSTNDPTDFSGASFGATLSGSALSGGVYPTTTYDSGTLTVTVNGFQASASYGQNLNNTPAALASALASALNASGSPVTASVSGTTITLTAKSVGAASNYPVSGGSSVSFTASGTTLSNGTDPGGLYAPLVTLYSYDTLGNLTCAEQHGDSPAGPHGDGTAGTGCGAALSNDATSTWRVRRFAYDSLGRLLTAKNPESGAISYTYDNDGNLLQQTSPAPNAVPPSTATQTVSYCYDELHRIKGKGYGAQTCPLATPVVSYVYDSGTNAKGHLTSMTDQAGIASYAFDVLGRMATETRSLTGANNVAISKAVSYEYNLNGSLKVLHYPSGAAVTYTPDSAGRMLSAVDSGSGINYVTSATYNATSALTGFVSGSGGAAAITNTFTYNKRLQPVTMSATVASQTVFSIGYDFHLGNGDNGNVFGITNYKDQNRNQTFTYDPLNRVTSAQNAGTDCTAKVLQNKTEYWGNGYTYDAWGNLLGKTITKCGAENLNLTADAHNWIHGPGTDYRYDPAGNMTYDATANLSYTFDQENRITGANGYTYTYDGDGNRVRKSNGNLAGNGTLYWYMSPGVVAETDLGGTLKSEYVFFAGERVARRDGATGTGSVFYYFSDNLKTASIITDSAGTIKAESDYYPWGGELQFVNNDSNHYKFTSKERDGESGLDYFGARYYSSGLGRWVSADSSATPEPVPYADLEDPQTLNLYAYVRNIPTSGIDADGHQHLPCSTSRCSQKLEENVPPKVTAEIKRIFDHPAVQAFVFVLTFEFGGAEEGGVEGGAGGAAGGTGKGVTEGVAGGTGKGVEEASGSAANNQVNTAARDTADTAQAEGRTNGTAAGLQTTDGDVVTGVSAGKGGTPGPNHPDVQQALDNVPLSERSPYHGSCAEIACLNAAKNAGKNVRGAKSATAKIRKPGHPSHGQPNPPCSTCQSVQQQLGVTDANGK